MELFAALLKAPQKIAWPVVAVGATLLWAPQPLADGLGINLFVEKYRLWIGVSWLFFLFVGLTPLLASAKKCINSWWQTRTIRNERVSLVQKLTKDEKALLQRFLDSQTKALDLDIRGGVVGRLLKIGFLELASNVSYGGSRGSTTFPVNIADWLYEYLSENPFE